MVTSATEAMETVKEIAAKTLAPITNDVLSAAEQIAGLVVTEPTDDAHQITVNPSANSAIVNSTPPVSDAELVSVQQTSSTDDMYSCAYEPSVGEENVTRYTEILQGAYSTSNAPFDVIAHKLTPGCFFDDDEDPAKGQCQRFCFLRCGFEFSLNVTTPMGGQGALVLLYLPPGYANLVNSSSKLDNCARGSLFNFPHVVIDISLADSSTLTIPYMSYKNYFNITGSETQTAPKMGSGRICVVALTKYNCGASTTNSIQFTLFGQMLDADLQCPRPLNLNAQGLQKVSPAKHTTVSFSHTAPMAINSTPGCINLSSFVTGNAAESTSLACEETMVDLKTAGARSAISDLKTVLRRWQVYAVNNVTLNTQGAVTVYPVNIVTAGTGTNVQNNSLFLICSNFQFFRGSLELRALVITSKGMSVKYKLGWFRSNTTSTVSYSQTRNTLFVVGDSDGPPPVLTIPFSNDKFRCAVGGQYGTAYFAVVNKTATNVICPTTCSVVLQIRAGPDFELSVPQYSDLKLQGIGDGADESATCFVNFKLVDVPITTTPHTNVDAIFGRSVFMFDVTNQTGRYVITPLHNPRADATNKRSTFNILSCFAYFAGEITITAVNFSKLNEAYIGHTYTKENAGDLNELINYGTIIVPPGGVKTFNAPFYSETPFRALNGEEALGFFLSYCADSTATIRVYASLRNCQFVGMAACANYTVAPIPAPTALSDQGPKPHKLVYKVTPNRQYCVEVSGRTYALGVDGSVEEINSPSVVAILRPIDPEFLEGVMKQLSYDHKALSVLHHNTAKLYDMLVTAFIYTCSDQAPDMTTLITRAMAVFQDLVSNDIVRLVLKTLVKAICYGIICVTATSVAPLAACAALALVDLSEIRLGAVAQGISEALVEGDIVGLVTLVLESVQGVDKDEVKATVEAATEAMGDQSPSLKGFTDFTNACKTVGWWLETAIKIIKTVKDRLFSTRVKQASEWLATNRTRLYAFIASVDVHLTKCSTNPEYASDPSTQAVHLKLQSDLIKCREKFIETPFTDIKALVNGAITRMERVKLTPVTMRPYRPEPYGVWIQGSAGAGKSFLSGIISTAVRKQYGYTTYYHPVASAHMDGYGSQEIHVFDDFGQCRDEADYTLVCNLISTSPFIVPKAELEAKGTYYNGRLVITTTNRMDFTSHKLFDPEALARRFPMHLHIRPRPQYTTPKGHLDVVAAIKDKQWNNVWEVKTDKGWCSLNVDFLLGKIIDEIEARKEIVTIMDQGDWIAKYDGQEVLFSVDEVEQQPQLSQRLKKAVDRAIQTACDFVTNNKWAFAAFGALSTLCATAAVYVLKYKEDEGAYSGGAPRNPRPKHYRDMKAPVSNQNILNSVVESSILEVVDITGHRSTALAIGKKHIVSYSHGPELTRITFYKGPTSIPLEYAYNINYDGEPTDLVVYKVVGPIQLTSPYTHFSDQLGQHPIMVSRRAGTLVVRPVEKIQPGGQITTLQGTTSSRTARYLGYNKEGDCGNVILTMHNGNYKILGIHTAGNGCVGYCNIVYGVVSQGQVLQKREADKVVFVPHQTNLVKSPCWTPDCQLEPAALSARDPRLDEPRDLLVSNCDKYTGNTFDISTELCTDTVAAVTAKLIEYGPFSPVDYETSFSILDMDWNTSPGHKYHNTCKQLLYESETFKTDVKNMLEVPTTYFVALLKDELRSRDKVRAGKTRVIEAANFDYVVAYRMVMGEFLARVIEDPEKRAGICLGLNPYTDFSGIVNSLYDNNLCLDFKGFDGSLSEGLMRAAVQCLANCSTDPELVVKIHEPTIVTTEIVRGEEWLVAGGMCSGSPSTTVLNCVCNLFIHTAFALVYQLDFKVYCYGDDVIFSTRQQYDPKDYVSFMKHRFGMTVTSAQKTDDITFVKPHDIEFLKRKPTNFYGVTVGALSLDSLEHKIQWCRGIDAYKQQLKSFATELALHGRDQYTLTTTKLGIDIPWGAAHAWAKALLSSVTEGLDPGPPDRLYSP